MCLPSRSPRHCAPKAAMPRDTCPATLLRILAFHFLLKMKSYDWFSTTNLNWDCSVLPNPPEQIPRYHLFVMPHPQDRERTDGDSPERSITGFPLGRARFPSSSRKTMHIRHVRAVWTLSA